MKGQGHVLIQSRGQGQDHQLGEARIKVTKATQDQELDVIIAVVHM